MENFLETSSKEAESETTQKNNAIIFQETKISEEEDQQKTPPINHPITSDQRPPREICCKPASTPDRLKVPKPFKYPER